MSDYKIKFGAIAVPAGGTGKALRVSICFSPRLYCPEDPFGEALERKDMGRSILRWLNVLLQERSGLLANLKLSSTGCQIALRLTPEFKKMWMDPALIEFREKIWMTLAHPQLNAHFWSDPVVGTTYQETAEASKTFEEARKGKSTVESLTIKTLEAKVFGAYGRIVLDPSNEGAMKEFIEIGHDFSFALERLSAFGGIGAKESPAVVNSSAGSSPCAGATEPTGRDQFHELISHLEEFPQLSRFLGLIADVEFNAEEIPGGETQIHLIFDAFVRHLSTEREIGEELKVKAVKRSEPGWSQFTTKFEKGFIPEAPGFAHLPTSEFTLLQYDPIGAAMQSLKAGRAMAPAGTGPNKNGASHPAILRSTGLSLTFSDTTEEAAKKIAALLNRKASKQELDGEALTRGFIADIGMKIEGKIQWQSICARTGGIRIKASLASPEGLLFVKPSQGSPQIHTFRSELEAEEIAERDFQTEEVAVVNIPAEAHQPITGVLLDYRYNPEDKSERFAVIATPLGDVLAKLIRPEPSLLPGNVYSFFGVFESTDPGTVDHPKDVELTLLGHVRKGAGGFGRLASSAVPGKFLLEQQKRSNLVALPAGGNQLITFTNKDIPVAKAIDVGLPAVATGDLDLETKDIPQAYRPTLGRITKLEIPKARETVGRIYVEDSIGESVLTVDESTTDIEINGESKKEIKDLHIGSSIKVEDKKIIHLGVAQQLKVTELLEKEIKLASIADSAIYALKEKDNAVFFLGMASLPQPQEQEDGGNPQNRPSANARDIVFQDFQAMRTTLKGGDVVEALGFRSKPVPPSTIAPFTIVSLRKAGRGPFELKWVEKVSEDEQRLRIREANRTIPLDVGIGGSLGTESPRYLVPQLKKYAWLTLASKNGAMEISDFRDFSPSSNSTNRLWGRVLKPTGEKFSRVVTSEGSFTLKEGEVYQEEAIIQVSIENIAEPQVLSVQALGAVHKLELAKSHIVPFDVGDEMTTGSDADVGDVVFVWKGGDLSASRARLIARVESVTEGPLSAVVSVLGARPTGSGNKPVVAFDVGRAPGGALRRLRIFIKSANNQNPFSLLLGLVNKIVEFEASQYLYLADSKDVLVRGVHDGSGQAMTFKGQWLENSVPKAFFLRAYLNASAPNERTTFDLYIPKKPNTPGQPPWPGTYKYDQIADSVQLVANTPASQDFWRVDESKQVALAHSIFTWNGESLASPPAFDSTEIENGKVISRSASDLEKTSKEPATLFPSYHPPVSSMFPLLFGHEYFVRLRALDIAGNCPPLSSDPDLSAHEGLLHDRYLRFDPIPGPKIVRSDNGVTATIYPENADDQKDPTKAPGATYLRSKFLAETNALEQIDSEVVFLILPPSTVFELARTHGELFPKMGGLGSADAIFDYIERVETQSQNDFIYDRRVRELPYMPDPLANAVVFELTVSPLDHLGETSIRAAKGISFKLKWPKATGVPVRFKSTRGPSRGPKMRIHNEELLVFVEPGETLKLRCTAVPGKRDLELLGLRRFVPNAQAEFDQSVLEGRNRYVSGYSEVIVGHAVNRPLSLPKFTLLEPAGQTRLIGDTFLNMNCQVELEPRSVGKIEIHAEWDEFLDNPAELLPSMPLEEARKIFDPLFEDMPAEEMDRLLNSIDAWRNLPNGKRPLLYPWLNLELPEFIDRLHLRPATLLEALKIFASCAPRQRIVRTFEIDSPVVGAPLIADRRLDFVHDLPSTRRVDIRYRAVASSPFSEAFKDRACELVSASGPKYKEVIAVATKRPAKLEIAKILPVYGWQEDRPFRSSEEETWRIRRGNALRVYLRRGWFSSGANEKVAVLFEDPAKPLPKNVRDLVVTQRGYDPVWVKPSDLKESGPLKPLIGEDFELATATLPLLATITDPGKPLDQQPAHPVLAAIHDVRYSPLKGLWYCDIAFKDPKAYMPFARLALARYQPGAIPGHELSEVSVAPFTQLHPERRLHVKRCGNWEFRLQGVFPAGKSPLVKLTLEPTGAETHDFFQDAESPLESLPMEKKPGEFFITTPIDRSKTGSILITEEAIYETESDQGALKEGYSIIYADRILLH